MNTGSKDPGNRNGAGLRHRLRALPKRYIALAALLPVLIVLWAPLLTGKAAKRAAPAPAPAPTTDTDPNTPPAVPGVETSPLPTSAGVVTAAATLQARLQALTTPFVPQWRPSAADSPFRPQAVAEVAAPEQRETSLTPTTIVLSAGETPIAIIGGQTYRPGDTIDGRTILTIEERRVLYRQGTRTYAVSLPEPTLRGDHD